jgi:hypothetical protein
VLTRGDGGSGVPLGLSTSTSTSTTYAPPDAAYASLHAATGPRHACMHACMHEASHFMLLLVRRSRPGRQHGC